MCTLVSLPGRTANAAGGIGGNYGTLCRNANGRPKLHNIRTCQQMPPPTGLQACTRARRWRCARVHSGERRQAGTDGTARCREASDTFGPPMMASRMGVLHALLVVLVLTLLSDGAVAKITQNRLYSDDMILESRE